MSIWRDVLAIGVAAAATAALGAWFILPNVYPAREPLGYLLGTVLSYEFRVGPKAATAFLDIRLDEGETIRVRSSGELVPGDRVCVRATRRGDLIEGYPVPMDRCSNL